MALKPQKHARKTQNKAMFSSAVTSKPKSTKIPPPFEKPNGELEDFIDTLDKKHIYILSLDTLPASFKRKIFFIPIITNLVLIAIMVYRLYTVLPWYIEIAGSVSSFSSKDLTLPLIMERFINFALDYFLYAVVLPWPRNFILGSHTGAGSPMSWRQTVAFQDTEIVVRRSRDWDEMVLMPGWDVVGSTFSGPREVFDEVVSRAVSLEVMGGGDGMERKTGYALMDHEWDLDWQCMIDAHSLVDGGHIPVEAFRTKVLVHSEQYGWVQWTVGVQSGGDNSQIEQAKIQRFKNIWNGMGKESLFFRWIEIVSQSGTVEWEEESRKKELRRLAQKMIEDEGMDFDEVLDAIGGWAGWPGLE